MATTNGHEQETRMDTKEHKEQDEPQMAGRLPPTIDKAGRGAMFVQKRCLALGFFLNRRKASLIV